jgi:hypothetical protein
MARWLATHPPEWVLAIVALVALPALVVALQNLIAKKMPAWRTDANNDATVTLVSTSAVVYSIAVGLVVVTLWGRFDTIKQANEDEATNLLAVVQGSQVFAGEAGDAIRRQVLAYDRDVVANWDRRIRGREAARVGQDLDDLVATVRQLEPATEAQRAYVDDAVARLGRARELRHESVRLASEQQLPGILWLVVVGGSLVVVGMCLTCSIEDGALRQILLVGVTIVVALNVLLVIELNYPLYGDFRVGPDSFQSAIAELQPGV